MHKSLAISNPTRQRFEIAAIRIVAISVAISTLFFTGLDAISPNAICDLESLHLKIKASYRYRLGGIVAIFCTPPGPYDLPGKISKIIRTGGFFPIKIFGGTQLVREFLFPAAILICDLGISGGVPSFGDTRERRRC